MRDIELNVHLARDQATGRWFVASSDIPGLWLEAESAASLVGKIEAAAPEMIELNAMEIMRRFSPTEEVPTDGSAFPPRRMSYRPVFDSPLLAA